MCIRDRPVVGSSSCGASVVSGKGSGSGSVPPANAVVEKAVRQSTAASVTVNVRMILFFIGIVLLFKIRLRGRGALQSAAAQESRKFLRLHVQAAHKLDDLQILLFGLCRFQLTKLLLQLRDLGLGFLLSLIQI